MKNNYFLRWTQRLLFLLTIMVGLNVSAQSFLISFPDHASAPVQNPMSLIIDYDLYLSKVDFKADCNIQSYQKERKLPKQKT